MLQRVKYLTLEIEKLNSRTEELLSELRELRRACKHRWYSSIKTDGWGKPRIPGAVYDGDTCQDCGERYYAPLSDHE